MNKYFLLPFLFVFFFTTGLLAQATLSIQGTVKNSDGTAAANGKYSIKFSLYTTESGGTPVWTETQDQVQVTGGVYSALLGASNPLNAAFDRVYYLGVAVDGGAEWVPRARLSSSPYALSLVGTGNVFPSSGAIGAGTVTPDPNTQLTVSGGADNSKLLITAPADKEALLWMRSGDKLAGMGMNSSALYITTPTAFGLASGYEINIASGQGMNITAATALNLTANNSQNVHLYSQGALKAYTDSEGFVIAGRLFNGSDLITASGVVSSANSDMYVKRNGDDHIVCRGDGRTEFKKQVLVTGGVDQYFNTNYYGLDPGGFARWTGNGTTPKIAFYTDWVARAERFITPSDFRIKKDLHISSGKADLATLMQLEVTDYRYVDTLTHGIGTVKGFVAQQVKKVFPEAVSTAHNAIPDIFAKPTSLHLNGDEATFRMSEENSVAKGDRVRIIQNGGEQKEYEVIGTEGTSFTVKAWNSAFDEAEKVFVYGREVKDFCQVDYDKIHTLNVSATQELMRQLEALRKENTALKSDVESLKAENSELKTADVRMEARMRALESKLLHN